MNKIFKDIDLLKEKYTKFWLDTCKIETPSSDKKAIDTLNSYIKKFAENLGFTTKTISFENAGDYLIVDLNEGAEKSYILAAHTDTVFKKGVFGEEIARIDGDFIYGPGTIDCKGGIAMSLLIMEVLKKNGFDKHVRLLLSSDEEVNNEFSGIKGVEEIIENAKGFIGGLSMEVANEGEILVSRKGILRYEVTVFGKSAHSGINYFDGINAIYEASHKIIALQKLSRVDGATYSCNIINAGTALNIVPDKCSFQVDIRYEDPKEKEVAKKAIYEIVNTSYIEGSSAEINLLNERDPMPHKEENINLFNKISEIAEKHSLEKLYYYSNGGGSDAAYLSAAGVPVVCGAGTFGEFCHTTKEYGVISSLTSRAKIYAELILSE